MEEVLHQICSLVWNTEYHINTDISHSHLCHVIYLVKYKLLFLLLPLPWKIKANTGKKRASLVVYSLLDYKTVCYMDKERSEQTYWYWTSLLPNNPQDTAFNVQTQLYVIRRKKFAAP